MAATNPESLGLVEAFSTKVCGPSLTTLLLGWSDLVSLLLLGLSVTVCGINPRRRIWGRGRLRNIFVVLFMGLNIIFGIARFLVEGICVTVGARQFLFASVIYCVRWIWLFCSLTRSDSCSAKAFRVACALKELKTIRLGSSTARGRRGDSELVVRRGVKEAHRNHGNHYWRGFEEYVRFDEAQKTWVIRLVEKELHSHSLDVIGTPEFGKNIGIGSIDELYKKFYDLIMTADAGNDELVVDYSPFLEEFGAVSRDTRQAQRVGAVGESDLGDVARRVAADACYYIWLHDGSFRTARHVEKINECVEKAADDFFE